MWKFSPFLKSEVLILLICLTSLVSARAQAPYSMTQAAGRVRATTATLNGMVVPNGNETTVWFEWGIDRNYGYITEAQEIGSGSQVVRVSIPLIELTEAAIYHFRLVASNSIDVAHGFDTMFTTGMQVHNWGSFFSGRPVIPSGLTNIVGVAAGHRHCLAICSDGSVVSWMVGTPDYGQADVPIGLSNVVAVAGGFSHSLALKEDGTVVAWGKYGNRDPADVPEGLTDVIAIAGGDFHSVALHTDGTLTVWGPDSSVATQIPVGLSNVVAISCGSSHTLALKADGTVTVWGNDPGSSPHPASATNLVSIATMGWWNLALRSDGTVVDWGPAFSGVPKPSALSNVVGIVTGNNYAEVFKADGTLEGWGNEKEVTGLPPDLSSVITFASGDYHRVGLAPVNLSPLTFNRSIWGSTNQPIAIDLLGFDPEGDLLSYRLDTLPSHGQLYQYTTNGLGAKINNPGTLVSNQSRVVFVPGLDADGAPYDSFSVIANDAELDSGPGTNTLSIVPPPRIEIVQPVDPSTSVTLTFEGITNGSYSVQRSLDLGGWFKLGIATNSSPTRFFFTDTKSSDTTVRFYRLRSP